VTPLTIALLVISLLVVLKMGGGRWLLIGILAFVGFVLAGMAEAANGTPPEQR
jgi:hypothetical protein